MNYLAHLHLADISHTSLPGALLGEYAKGQIDERLTPELRLGVRLHRQIDSFTDAHPLHKGEVQALPAPYRRYGGIIMDMMFDHFLARYWSHYHSQPLTEFIAYAHQQLTPSPQWPNAMVRLVHAMQRYQLLASYQTLEGINLALARIDMRFRKPSPLPHCMPLLESHYSQMEQAFVGFYPQLMAFVQHSAQHDTP
ncbi:acyl carrier protein phosphodiesterase [Oceanisphaera avium]|uniref:ACP phosphodiesterase n=1 Tax=Oceanisphaera avium TaxID=1903694 RepID=A0A1Y0CU41_9GAMM|nr:ACP phosphodiesterase [Oceanisphaera avium]ART78738.1 hypothetical protein CBP12_00055 [Oceanisphaera avium]